MIRTDARNLASKSNLNPGLFFNRYKREIIIMPAKRDRPRKFNFNAKNGTINVSITKEKPKLTANFSTALSFFEHWTIEKPGINEIKETRII